MVCFWLNFNCGLLRVQGGNLHAINAFPDMVISLLSVDWLVHTILVICANVLKMLFLAEMEWLLSHWR